MIYSVELKKLTRTPITVALMNLDYCGNIFGITPCRATGAPCFNTFPTCKDKIRYTRQGAVTQKEALDMTDVNYVAGMGMSQWQEGKGYRFSSLNAALPFQKGEKPYIKAVKYLPTEIKNNLTINARITCELCDEPDSDINSDPYLLQRNQQYLAGLGLVQYQQTPTVKGTYWKRLLARNPNYEGRLFKIYEGFTGLDETEYKQKWVGNIDNITLGKGIVKIEVVDLLKTLNKIDVPAKIDIKLASDITDISVSATFSTVEGLDAPNGYIRIGDEIIYYTFLDAISNQLGGFQRGYFETDISEHRINDKIQKVRYFPPMNPFDLLKEMLSKDAGMPDAYIDSETFGYWRDFPGGEINLSAIISEPVKLDKLYFEILDLIDCKSWVAEDLRITIRRNLPNQPGRGYAYFSDEANLIHNSASVDLNTDSRLSRILVYWDISTLGKTDAVTSYNRLDIGLDADAESANEFNEIVEKKIMSRWLHSAGIQEDVLYTYIKNNLLRQIWRYRDAMALLTFDVEMKDSEIKTGEYCKISTDELLDKYGNPLVKATFQIVRREWKNNKLNLKALQITPRKIAFFAPNSLKDKNYIIASDAEREYACFSDKDGLMPDGSIGYCFY
ncbi:MAG TPA: hypothetical protein ACFYEK_17735 [Candidatus Wunengus sp. YC60]|uniref:hypothetical protein n=1 Tax=Candidatus Wunengus sp. YC60 TaxID=3367697 RepID=UPI004027C285